jgi:hypothetical protein
MTKMPKMKKVSNLFLLLHRDDQLAYFILFTPLEFNEVGHVIIGLATSPLAEHSISYWLETKL